MAKFLQYGDRGSRVEQLQRSLNDSPKFKPRRKLKVDGEMGTLTCAAVQQAKFRLGYETSDMDPDVKDQIAGARFFALLSGKEKLPIEYQKRRARRLKARLEKRAEEAKAKPMRVKALEAAHADIGIFEGPNNTIKYNTWWTGGGNDGAPYCVRAGAYWYTKAGSQIISRSAGRYQGTDYLLGCAKSGQFGLHLTSDPDPGTGFVIDFSGKSDPDHFGLFVKDLGGGNFSSIEANATLADGSQGVGFHTRAYRNCWFIGFSK